MADLLNFSITRGSNTQLTVPTWTISGKVVDSKTQQTVIADFTGANTVSFPQVLGNLTSAQQDEFVAQVVIWLLQKRFNF